MHLFAFLLTAAFASQFTAISNLLEFGVTPAAIKTTGAVNIVVKQLNQGAGNDWAGTVSISLTLTKIEPVDGTFKAAATAEDPDDDTKKIHTISTNEFSTALTGIANGDTVYVWVKADKTTPVILPDAAEIAVNDADFTVDPRAVKFTETKDVIVTQIDTEAENAWKTPVHLAFTLVNEQPTEGFVNAPAEGLSNAGGYKLSVEFLDKLPAVLPGDKIYVWVKVNAGHATDEEILEVPAVITVTPADFIVSLESIHLAKAQAGGVTSLVLTANTAADWTKNTDIYVTLSSDPTCTANFSTLTGVKVKADTDGIVTLTLIGTDWTALNLKSSADKIYIFCDPTDATHLETVPAVIHILDDFTVLPKKAFQFDTKVLALKITPTAESWVTTKKIKVKLANETLSNPTTDTGFFVTAAGIAFANGAYTVGDAAFGAATFATHKKIWVYVAVDAGSESYTYVMEPMTIEFVPTEFNVDPLSVKDTATTIAAAIEPVTALTTAVANKVTVYILRAPVDDPTTITAAGTLSDADASGLSFDFDAPIPAGPRLTKTDLLYVYVSYVETGDTEKTWYTHGRTLTVAEDLTKVRFEVSPTSISVDDLQKDDTRITITQKYGTAWTEISAQLTLEDKAQGATLACEDLDVTADVAVITWTQAIKTYLTGAAPGKKITVKVDPLNGEAFMNIGADITLAAGRLVSIEPEVEKKQWDAGYTIEVTVDDSITWTAAMGIIVSLQSGTDTVTGDLKKTGLTMTGGKVNVSIATEDLTGTWANLPVNTVLYIFYSIDGAGKAEQTPAELTIIEDIPVLEFAVGPSTIKDNVDKIEGLTITPTDKTGWGATIGFMVTDVDPTSDAVANVNIPGTATQGSGDKIGVWTATADVVLQGITLAPNKKLYVYASMANDVDYLDIPDVITVEAATEPTFDFTLSLTTITDEAMKANLAEMTVTPKTGTTFTDKTSAKGVFSTLAPTTAAQAHADGVEVDLTFVAGTPAKYKMEGDEYKLEDVIPTTVPGKIYFYLKEKDTDAWSIFGAPIDVTKKGGDAAMGVSPFLSLLAALVFLFVKLF